MALTRSRSALIVVAILASGAIALVLLASLRPDAPVEEPIATAPLVSVTMPTDRSDYLHVSGSGTVRPSRQVALVAEVAGKVIETAPSFVSGGRFRAGTRLVRIDPADYENAVAMAEAETIQRQYELVVAREESAVARAEWERVQDQSGTSDDPPETALGRLVLREPQEALAQAALRAAEARLADARTRLDRTRILAPFDGRVLTESIDVGQYVGPGAVVATVYATDAVEITVRLQAADAALIPGLWQAGSSGPRIVAEVSAAFGDRSFTWQGRVDRVDGSIDAATRTVGVIVRVDDPTRADPSGRPPLLPGQFVNVIIKAPTADRYLAIPSEALRDGNTVWVVVGDVLHIRDVDVLHQSGSDVLVRSGLEVGEAVVTSNLLVVTDGMAVRSSIGTDQ